MSLDHDSVLRLLLGHRAMLVGYILSIVRDRHLAEDVFQNVSLLVVRKREALRAAADFPAWARTIARFEALNAARKRDHAPQVLDAALLDALEEPWRAGDAAAPSATLDALRACLERLTPHARRVVELRYRENLSGRTLAEKLARPLNTIYVALARAHRALAGCVRMRLSQEGIARG